MMRPDSFFAVDENGKQFPFEQFDDGRTLRLTLKRAVFQKAKQLRLLPELGTAQAGEEGYFILPRTLGMTGEFQTFFTPREDQVYTYNRPVMSWYGIKKADFCCLIRVERNYYYSYEIKVQDNCYTACPLFDFTTHDPVYDDIRLELVFLPEDADYNTMARMERQLRLERAEICTLAEKCRKEAVEYARKYPVIRIRMGWKPSPSPMLIQTESNEPEMFVACDFARVRDIADELKRQGVEGAELQLVGWNRSGHDGRFPQLFPADPRLGGDAELKKTIDYVKTLGYRISTHTNTIDSYPIADTFEWDDVVVDRNGTYNQTGHYSGGLAYRVCMEKQLKNTKRDLPPLAAYGENGLHFTDVISIVPPDECHSPDHPCNTNNSIVLAQRIMEYTRGLFGGFSSEGCMDFALKHLDFGLYVSFGDGFGKNDIPFADRHLPLWEVAYHGIALYNPVATTVNFSAQPPVDRLTLLMRGGKPAMYFYSKFRSNNRNWMGENDLTCATDEALQWSVGKVKEGLEAYEPFADRQLVFMYSYEIKENGLHIATYEDGAKLYGNFTDQPLTADGITLEPWGYQLVD